MWKHLIFTSGAGVGCVPHGPKVVVIRGNVVVVTTLVVVLVFGTETFWELPVFHLFSLFLEINSKRSWLPL